MHDLVIRRATIVDGTGTEPFVGDLAIDGRTISLVGKVAGRGAREIDATNLIATPGWVDIHTHYDGQATWDAMLSPSCCHGVTTVVMGNCGVGFAPARPDRHDWLIELMEGVEDIPGSALSEGISWGWESFPEYLDVIDSMPRVMDVGVHVPHGPVRAYVMGDRGARNEAATAGDIVAMADIVRKGMEAGALGFSTSRTLLHRAKDGEPVPGTFANAEELLGIGDALACVGHGVFEMASDMTPLEAEFSWIKQFSIRTGMPVTFALLQTPVEPDRWREMLRLTDAAREEGANVIAQIACRPTGLILGWRSSMHPFSGCASYEAIAHLTFDERIEKLRDPAVRAAILADPPPAASPLRRLMREGFGHMFRLSQSGSLDYEPSADQSVAELARRSGQAPQEVVYDMMMERDGCGYVYLPILNYAHFNFDTILEMMRHPAALLSLSDGGAHCGVICDASFPTFMLTHWVRDRSRGERLSLEEAVAMQTSRTASLYGLHDRGVLAPGMKADLNLIDLQRLKITEPEMIFDLPANGRRLFQGAEGYRATIVSGQVTFEDGEPSGARPGRLVRGPQPAPLSQQHSESASR